MSIRVQIMGAAAAICFGVLSFSPASADGFDRQGAASAPSRHRVMRETCFHGPGADRSRCRYKVGHAARPLRAMQVRHVVSARTVYRRVAYAPPPPCTFSTVAGATTYAPLYNRPVDRCY